MRQLVVDTNEFIYSVLSIKSYSAEIMHLIYSGSVDLFINNSILDEYRRVLAYEKFNLSVARQAKAINDIIYVQ